MTILSILGNLSSDNPELSLLKMIQDSGTICYVFFRLSLIIIVSVSPVTRWQFPQSFHFIFLIWIQDQLTRFHHLNLIDICLYFILNSRGMLDNNTFYFLSNTSSSSYLSRRRPVTWASCLTAFPSTSSQWKESFIGDNPSSICTITLSIIDPKIRIDKNNSRQDIIRNSGKWLTAH